MAAASQRIKTLLTMSLCSAALAGCSGNSDGAAVVPPPGDIVVVNHGLPADPITEMKMQDEAAVMAPTALHPDETLVVESPPLQEGVPQPIDAPVSDEVVAVVEAPVVAAPAVPEEPSVPMTEAQRIAMLEKEVMALRADYNAMMPAFNGLITTNQRIQVLLKELEQQAGLQADTLTDAAPKTVAPSKDTAAPAAVTSTTGGPMVAALRIGEHGDKTRLVLDVSAVTAYSTDVDAEHKQLVITLPDAGWAGKGAATGLRSPLVAGWNVRPGEKAGSIVTIDLKKDAKVVSTERLKGTADTPARIVIDIAPGAAS